jgi:hypothetical protein
MKGRLTSASNSDIIDPALICHEVEHNRYERQDRLAGIGAELDEGSGEVAGELWDFNTAWSPPPLAASDPLYTDGEFASDYTALDEYLAEPLYYEPSGSRPVNDPSFELVRIPESESWNKTFQVQSTGPGTNHSPPDRVGSSKSGTLSGDVGSSTTTHTPGKSPQFWTNNGAIQSPCSENIPDTRQNPTLDYSSQYQGSRDGQVRFLPSPLPSTEIGDDNSKTIGWISHTTPSERGSSLPLRDHAASKSHDASHNSIPGCGILDFSNTEKGKNESVNKERDKRKRSPSVQGQRTNPIPKRRAQHGAICVRCKLFREKVCHRSHFWSSLTITVLRELSLRKMPTHEEFEMAKHMRSREPY